ncbi:hypothetical protein N7471_013408 [Penicillium samsonianum]|uniref:uncharacterized protein n=1 Tax=Penicillium samsonianum TaxID=1882272 RepID=UPI002548B9E4|nr:uncharacterized protein N7471_013408 [Penicillium samsonianum]KAJ6118788.1 hypothetical protein N7471_013408 [Penicillium samsonianum]
MTRDAALLLAELRHLIGEEQLKRFQGHEECERKCQIARGIMVQLMNRLEKIRHQNNIEPGLVVQLKALGMQSPLLDSVNGADGGHYCAPNVLNSEAASSAMCNPQIPSHTCQQTQGFDDTPPQAVPAHYPSTQTQPVGPSHMPQLGINSPIESRQMVSGVLNANRMYMYPSIQQKARTVPTPQGAQPVPSLPNIHFEEPLSTELDISVEPWSMHGSLKW